MADHQHAKPYFGDSIMCKHHAAEITWGLEPVGLVLIAVVNVFFFLRRCKCSLSQTNLQHSRCCPPAYIDGRRFENGDEPEDYASLRFPPIASQNTAKSYLSVLGPRLDHDLEVAEHN